MSHTISYTIGVVVGIAACMYIQRNDVCLKEIQFKDTTMINDCQMVLDTKVYLNGGHTTHIMHSNSCNNQYCIEECKRNKQADKLLKGGH